MSKRAVLWDLDGTLVDSSDHHWSSWRDTLTAAGVDLTYEMFLSDFRKRNDDILRIRLGEGAPSEAIARVADEKENRYRALVREQGVVVLPGVPEWLERLSAAGWLQALASSAPPANIEAIFEVTGMGRYFAAAVSSEQVSRGKPHPDVFVAAAERLGVDASRCVVVEDAPSGIEAARRAEMRSVGVLTTHDSLDADVVVASLADLPENAFERLLG